MTPVAILKAASVLVPRAQRQEWLAEWSSELWYVEDARAGSHGFCMGAFRDAIWIRWNAPLPPPSRLLRWSSPSHCLMALAALAVLSFVYALHWQAGRELGLTSPYRDPSRLVTIAAHQHFGKDSPTVRVAQYQRWKRSPRHFSDVALYRTSEAEVRLGQSNTASLTIAETGDDLFGLLGVALPSHMEGKLILGRASWKRYFGNAPEEPGRSLELDGQPVEIGAILDDEYWQPLPGKMDGWLLSTDSNPDQNCAARGFVVARLARNFPKFPRGFWHITLPDEGGSVRSFDCESLARQIEDPFTVLLFANLLTLLVFYASQFLSGGALIALLPAYDWRSTLRRAAFLSVEVLLLLVVVVAGGLDLGHLLSTVVPIHIEPQILATGWLLAARWIIRDRRERCPECLHLLSHPVPMGQASQTFLGWYGTELLCTRGHGLLYVPELPSNSCSSPRWSSLDSSLSSPV